ncbi:SidA/IucD/PvdA family monooxygenase [Nocardia sp. NPDC050793]|uniref:lysine N(6)-hydroxylase/L-ornithine N(5)-oxygenase family protein n=1 Tax=Nocardia sp. NPDC050793 TaxID=3155159 RepID=UPI0033FB7B4C
MKHTEYDVVGIGFGPSNIALAIALLEHGEGNSDPVTAAFLERKQSFGWHQNMLLPSAKMQVSFLKDLATFRNPATRFGFVSYLHAKGRLPMFVNRKDFFPTRREFHDYLEWAAAKLSGMVAYGSEVVEVTPASGGDAEWPVRSLRVKVRTAEGFDFVECSNIVVSTGLEPRLPDGVVRGSRIWHSSEFLERFRECGELSHVAVVGAGQSGAEIVRFLYDALPEARISAILPAYGYSIADNTPFANEVYDPVAVDDYYFGSADSKSLFWRYHKNTNYSVVDSDVADSLYQRKYDDEVSGVNRLSFVTLTRITEARDSGGGVHLGLRSVRTGSDYDMNVDTLVCATGYGPMNPGRLLHRLDPYLLRDDDGRYRIDRDYRIVTAPELQCGIYLQGGTEHTHGLSSSLLSSIAVRGGEITESIVKARRRRGEYSDPEPAEARP